ncbi:TPA: hypothetical protein QHX44_000231 [Klebsiella oxytoca]|nr:hypothetical protein [Klebsiella oxytoca]
MNTSNSIRVWLQQAISSFETARDDIPYGLNDDQSKALEVLRFALAKLNNEPQTFEQSQHDRMNDILIRVMGRNPHIRMTDLHAAALALTEAGFRTTPTQMMPDEMSWKDAPVDITEGDMGVALAWAHGFNQCRAMNQITRVSQKETIPVSEGYHLVPKTPTLEMLQALGIKGPVSKMFAAYNRMLVAAPAPADDRWNHLDEMDD